MSDTCKKERAQPREPLSVFSTKAPPTSLVQGHGKRLLFRLVSFRFLKAGHHDAVFDMRSKPVAGGHGHQATFDAAGNLVTNGTIACGTADYVSPESIWNGSKYSHKEEDVQPYFFALHLDGNPGLPDNGTGLLTELVPSRLTRPCIHQGFYTRQYLRLRPSFPTGTSHP